MVEQPSLHVPLNSLTDIRTKEPEGNYVGAPAESQAQETKHSRLSILGHCLKWCLSCQKTLRKKCIDACQVQKVKVSWTSSLELWKKMNVIGVQNTSLDVTNKWSMRIKSGDWLHCDWSVKWRDDAGAMFQVNRVHNAQTYLGNDLKRTVNASVSKCLTRDTDLDWHQGKPGETV